MEDLELFKSFLFKIHSFNSTHINKSRVAKRHYVGYLYRGFARIVSEEGVLELQEGDCFYIPKGCCYHSYWYGPHGTKFDSFAFAAIPEEAPMGFCLQKINMTEKARFFHESLAKDRTVNARSVGLLYQLLWEILPAMKQIPHGKSQILARKIANDIYEHPNQRADQTARNCGVSESTIYHILKKEMRCTPNRLRQEAKCRQAIDLLTCTDLGVEQISIRLGFSSSSYMRKLLRAATGKTPLEIRKSAQNI